MTKAELRDCQKEMNVRPDQCPMCNLRWPRRHVLLGLRPGLPVWRSLEMNSRLGITRTLLAGRIPSGVDREILTVARGLVLDGLMTGERFNAVRDALRRTERDLAEERAFLRRLGPATAEFLVRRRLQP